MKKQMFRSHYRPVKSRAEKLDKKSETIPDQSYTIPELLRKHAQGVSPAVSKVPLWGMFPDETTWDEMVNDFDLIDAQNMLTRMEERKEEIVSIRERIKGNEKKTLDNRIANMQKKIKELESQRKTPETQEVTETT